MKLCIFLKMHMVLSLDNFNITYNLKQRAQACLGRFAPCLGLIVYFDSNVQYRLSIIESKRLKLVLKHSALELHAVEIMRAVIAEEKEYNPEKLYHLWKREDNIQTAYSTCTRVE